MGSICAETTDAQQLVAGDDSEMTAVDGYPEDYNRFSPVRSVVSTPWNPRTDTSDQAKSRIC